MMKTNNIKVTTNCAKWDPFYWGYEEKLFNKISKKETITKTDEPTWCGATRDEWAELYESATIID